MIKAIISSDHFKWEPDSKFAIIKAEHFTKITNIWVKDCKAFIIRSEETGIQVGMRKKLETIGEWWYECEDIETHPQLNNWTIIIQWT